MESDPAAGHRDPGHRDRRRPAAQCQCTAAAETITVTLRPAGGPGGDSDGHGLSRRLQCGPARAAAAGPRLIRSPIIGSEAPG